MERIKSIFQISVVPEGQGEIVLLEIGDFMHFDSPISLPLEREHEVQNPINNQAAYIHDLKTVLGSFSFQKIERFRTAEEAQSRFLANAFTIMRIGKCVFRMKDLSGSALVADAILTAGNPSLQPTKRGRITYLVTEYNFTLTGLKNEQAS